MCACRPAVAKVHLWNQQYMYVSKSQALVGLDVDFGGNVDIMKSELGGFTLYAKFSHLIMSSPPQNPVMGDYNQGPIPYV